MSVETFRASMVTLAVFLGLWLVIEKPWVTRRLEVVEDSGPVYFAAFAYDTRGDDFIRLCLFEREAPWKGGCFAIAGRPEPVEQILSPERQRDLDEMKELLLKSKGSNQ